MRISLFQYLDDLEAGERLDDRPYGGGPGMLMRADRLHRSLTLHGKAPFILFSPRGEPLTQKLLEEYKDKDFSLVSSSFEGVDERLYGLPDLRPVSTGPYILSSGESAALVFLDAFSRLLPGALSEDSLIEESRPGDPEPPQYTRPRRFQGQDVPEVLLSGNPSKIEDWKKSWKDNARLKTRRPPV